MTVDIPAPIQNIIGRRSFTRDTIGMSGSRVLCFEDMVLKITPAKEGAEADQECRMMAWLSGKLPVPQILCVQRERGVHYLLMSRTAGPNGLCAAMAGAAGSIGPNISPGRPDAAKGGY